MISFHCSSFSRLSSCVMCPPQCHFTFFYRNCFFNRFSFSRVAVFSNVFVFYLTHDFQDEAISSDSLLPPRILFQRPSSHRLHFAQVSDRRFFPISLRCSGTDGHDLLKTAPKFTKSLSNTTKVCVLNQPSFRSAFSQPNHGIQPVLTALQLNFSSSGPNLFYQR